jgi:hypothetical protein
MTMEAGQELKRSDETLRRNTPAEDRRRARSRGAGLYAEVQPMAEIRPLALAAAEDAD